jgi:uncharacterized protein
MRDHNPDGPEHFLCRAYRQFHAYTEGRLRALSERVPHPVPAPGEPTQAPKPVGRNEPCPCGSGKKYKKCCGRRR